MDHNIDNDKEFCFTQNNTKSSSVEKYQEQKYKSISCCPCDKDRIENVMTALTKS